MYIAPNSELYILYGIPIEGSYEHTLMFDTPTQQLAYFTTPNKVLYHVTDLSYIRVNKNTIKLELPIERLYNANYMMFRNNAFGTKPFFAFITNVEYINNVTTEITYELDVIQTWLFDFSVGDCFIEREHSGSDAPGDNLIPENLELGEYEYDEFKIPDNGNMFKDWSIGILSSVGEGGSYIGGSFKDNIYNGLQWFIFKTDAEANRFIGSLTDAQKADSIICVIMIPDKALDGNGHFSRNNALDFVVPNEYYPNGFTPKNNKLKTAPYTQILATDYQGHAASYKYEYFPYYDGALFQVMSAVSSIPQFALVPVQYKGNIDMNEALLISDLPQCAFTIDSFRAWIAMKSNVVGAATDLVSGIANVAGSINLNPSTYVPKHASGITTDSMVGAGALTGAMRISNSLARAYDTMMMPPQTKSIGSGSLVFQSGNYGFHIFRTYIRWEYAAIIDDYFTMYGYATHRVKVPNLYTSLRRPYWNYVKTIGCRLNGSIPVEYERAICSLFDSGITFWSNPENYMEIEVGNYGKNNSPRRN